MKKMSKILMMLGLASLVTFTACKKNDSVADATINITASPSSSTITAGTQLTLTLEFTGNADNKLKSYTVTSSQATSPIATGSLSGTTGNAIVKDTPSVGIAVYTVTLTSEKGAVTKSYNVTVVANVNFVLNTSDFDLGNQTSSVPKFWSAKRDNVYNLSDAVGSPTLQADLDFAYCTRSATNGGNKLIAPSSQDATDIYTTQWAAASEKISNWTNRNSTKFALTSIASTDLTGATSDAAIAALIATARTSGEPTADNVSVQDGKVYLFKTQGGAYGLILNVSATGTFNTTTSQADAGQAQLIVKYQQQQ